MTKINLSVKILIGLLLGGILGVAAKTLAHDSTWLPWVVQNITLPTGQIFLRLLFMLVIPMLFSALVIGICGLDVRHLGRIGVRTLGYTVVASLIAVLIGMSITILIQPGAGLPQEARDLAMANSMVVTIPKLPDTTGVALLVTMIPDNPVKAAANGEMIAVILFSLIFGVGLSLTKTPGALRLREAIEGLYDVSMTLIHGVLKLAPYGVAALIFTMTARLGTELLPYLMSYVGVVLLGLGLQMFVVYPLSIRFLGGRSPLAFFRSVRVAMITAFATASSSATLPTALTVAEENLQLPRHVSRFVLTAGSAMNQNGTALFEGVTVLFLAQLFGVDLSLGQQFLIMLICVMAGIGTAGVPAGSLPVIAMILVTFGIPIEGLALILGVDRFLDMCRTTLNVTGDLVAAVYVARGEPAVEVPAATGTSSPAS